MTEDDKKLPDEGKTPKIKVTSQRGGICLSSAISPAGRMVFRIEKETFTSKTFIDFIKQVMKNHKWRKIIIITDNYHPHKSKTIKSFVEKGGEKGDYILIQGEWGYTYEMVKWSKENGFVPIYSSTERNYKSEVMNDGTVKNVHYFKHVCFKEY